MAQNLSRERLYASIQLEIPLSRQIHGPGAAPVRAWASASSVVASRALWDSLLTLAAAGCVWYLQQWIGAFLLLVALIGFGAWRAASVLFRPATLADALLLTITTAAVWIVLVAEALSAGRLLGAPLGWLAGGAALAIGARWLPAARAPWLRISWSWVPCHPLGRLLLGVITVHLGAVFVLTWVTGINVGDSVASYLPRSVRFLQNGTFAVHATHYDYLPGFHQTLVAIQLLFLKADILVVPMSFLIGLATSLGVFAFSRSLRWPSPLPLAAAVLPWMMPEFLLHASAANFDILTGFWLLLALYFLRRGYAASSPRWLMAAALATALALATKPTFWFAAPGLGACWLFTLYRAWRRSGLRTSAARSRSYALKLAGAAACLIAVVGMPFIARNLLIYRTPLGPPELRAFIVGEMSLPDRFHLLAFNTLALGYQLVLPPSLMSREQALRQNERFQQLAESLSFRLPDERLTPVPDWSELIRYAMPGHRYDSNHASFGAAFALLVLPSMLVLPLLRRRLGPRWPFAAGLVFFGISYLLVYGFVYRYQTGSIRLLVEGIIPLVVIAPAWIALLPRATQGLLMVAFGLLLIPEMNDVIQNSRWTPPQRVMQTPRIDQIFVFGGSGHADMARLLERKYPPSELPELLIHDEGSGHPGFPDYTFLGPTLQRRTAYWVPKPSAAPPLPLLTFDAALARQLVADGMLPDRLSADLWLLLPNDRLRVRMTLVQESAAAEQLLKLEASVPPGKYRTPSFAVFLLDGGNTIPLQRFGPQTTLSIPLHEARKGALRIEVRDGEQGRTAERVIISKAVLTGL